jgi:hypothetical protein
MTPRSLLRPAAALLAAGGLAASLAGVALASNGITPLSPKSGQTVPAGKSPTFKMRVHGKGEVFVLVCKSPKRHKDGTICHGASIGQAHKHGGVFTYKPQFFDFPAFWLNTPGTYYWQAYRIDCSTNLKDCKKESKVTRFKVG